VKTRRLSRTQIVAKIIGIVRSVDSTAGLPELIPCQGQLIMWWQNGDGRRLVVDVGRDETFVELIDGRGQCQGCWQVRPGEVSPNGGRLDLWSLVRAGYEWMRAPL
jgi:hypothetical protein